MCCPLDVSYFYQQFTFSRLQKSHQVVKNSADKEIPVLTFPATELFENVSCKIAVVGHHTIPFGASVREI